MATHSYWRIRYRTAASSNAQYSEVFFYDASNVDLCTGGTVIKSSEFNGTTFAAANAFDRNTTTTYAAQGHVGQWIGYHFASPVDVAKVGFTASATNPSENAIVMVVEYSDNGVDWFLYATIDDPANAMSAAQHRVFTLVPIDITSFDGGPHRYWKIELLLTGTGSGYTTLQEVNFLDSLGASLNDAHSHTMTASDDQAPTFPASALTDNNSGTQWYTDGNVHTHWFKIDFGSGNAYAVNGMDFTSPGSNPTWVPTEFIAWYSDDNSTWTYRDDFALSSLPWATSTTKTITFGVAPPSPITGTYVFGREIESPAVQGTYSFGREIEANTITGTFEFGRNIQETILGTYEFGRKIDLYFTVRFGRLIDVDQGDVYGYKHNYGGTRVRPLRVQSSKGAYVAGEGMVTDAGAKEIIDHVIFDPLATMPYYHFYGDFYERIWISPNDIRLSNPRIGFQYPIYIWNGYSVSNDLEEYYADDLPGILLVEDPDFPITFERYEARELHYVITDDAPSEVDGKYTFTFTLGLAKVNIFALVLGILKTLPNEPITEVWAWLTTMQVSYDGSEQRQGLREQPRNMVAYNVMIQDDSDRRTAYQQFYSFASRTVLVPMFQYIAPLDQAAEIGDTRIYFDLGVSDIRVKEYIVLYRNTDQLYELQQVKTLYADGVELVQPLAFEAGLDWEVVPARNMRLPNKSSFDMEAQLGLTKVAGESNVFRSIQRPGSVIAIPQFDGFDYIPYKPLVVNEIPETFVSDVSVIDNGIAAPKQVSTWETPFVGSEVQFLIDRTNVDDMDWWRKFLDDRSGRLGPFIMQTWRDDLPLVEPPELGDGNFLTSNTDYADYFNFDTYKHVVIHCTNGERHQKIVTGILRVPEGLRVTVDGGIGSVVGDNEIEKISFANTVRLDDDEVQIEHYRNWSIVTLQTRLVNA